MAHKNLPHHREPAKTNLQQIKINISLKAQSITQLRE